MSQRILVLVAVLLLAGGAAAQTASVAVTDAWARATPGKAENGAAYLTLESPTADRLIAVSTPVAKKAELHLMTTEGGVMRMRSPTAIDLPAGKPVTLKPGAMHIMLTGLTQPLRPGESFPLTLTFEKAGTREVTVAVEKPGAMAPEKASSGMKMPMGH